MHPEPPDSLTSLQAFISQFSSDSGILFSSSLSTSSTTPMFHPLRRTFIFTSAKEEVVITVRFVCLLVWRDCWLFKLGRVMQLGLREESFKLWSRSESHCTTSRAANPLSSFVKMGLNCTSCGSYCHQFLCSTVYNVDDYDKHALTNSLNLKKRCVSCCMGCIFNKESRRMYITVSCTDWRGNGMICSVLEREKT